MNFGYILPLYIVVIHMLIWCIAIEDEINAQMNSEKENEENKKIRPKVSDKYCQDKFSCKANHTCVCHTDSLCELFSDCCKGFKTGGHSTDFTDIYSCLKIPAKKYFGAVVVTACPKEWTNNESRTLCGNNSYISKLKKSQFPKTYMTNDGIVFYNIFCAYCNSVLPKMYNLHTLKMCADGLQQGEKKNENCTLLYDKVARKDSVRKCPRPDINSSCPQGTPYDVEYNCTRGEYGIVYDMIGNVYRNTYCALCHNISVQNMSCELDKVDVCFPYSFTILIKNSTDIKVGENQNDNLVYITVIVLSISIVALFIMLIIYCRFPKLLNVSGKIAFCLALSLLVAQLLFLISSETEPIPWLCKVMAILVHYFYLVTFCWMNVIAFDLFKTFSNYHLDWEDKRFLYYSLYAWLLPFVIVTVSVILNFIEGVGSFNPRYGETKCWFNSEPAKLIFFLIPLAVLKMLDILAFFFTVYHIRKARREASFARKNETCSFLIYIKLSLIMGLTWIFAFLARFTDSVVLAYMFTIFNACQGVSLFLCFVLTNTVFKLVKGLYSFSQITSSSTTKSTQC